MLAPTWPRQSLAGRVVLVTGVVAGIGREVVRLLDAADAVIVGADRDADRFAAVQRELPRVELHRADVSDAGDRAALVARVLADHGRVDALVNSAGLGWTGLVEEMTLEDLERLYATNLVAFADLVRLLLPQMRERRDGDVLVVSSGAAWVSTPPLTVYSSTKFGVDGLVEGLRLQPLRGLTDLGLGLAAGRLGALGRAAAERRTP